MRRVLFAVLVATATACSSSDSPSAAREARAPDPCPEQPAGQEKVTMQFGGVERWYLRRVPPVAHDARRRMPLVVDLHGFLEGAEIHASHSDLGSYGAEHGFVTVTPQGSMVGTIALWDFGAGSGDVRFIGALLDDVERTTCIDPARIYVTGLSNGGLMTSRVACAYADRIAAAAPVAGITDPEGCDPSRPVPIVAFHGTADPYLPYGGGLGQGALDLPAPDGSGRRVGDLGPALEHAPPIPAVPDSVAAWARRNGCTADASERKIADDVTLVSHDCPDGAETELYRVEGGGHSWPGSPFSQSIAKVVGPTTTSITANEVMWEFFQAHAMEKK